MEMSYVVRQVDPSSFRPLHAGPTAKTEAELASSRSRQLSPEHRDYRMKIPGVRGQYLAFMMCPAGSFARSASYYQMVCPLSYEMPALPVVVQGVCQLQGDCGMIMYKHV